MKLERIERGDSAAAHTTLLLVHGVCHAAWYYEDMMQALAAKGFHCVALSLRGHGQSEGHEALNTWTLDDYVQDVLDTVHTLPRKPVLLGHSMGGAVAQRYAGLYADTLAGVVLLCAPPATGMSFAYKLRRAVTDPVGALWFLRMAYGHRVTDAQLNRSMVFSRRLSAASLRQIHPRLEPESRRAIAQLARPYTANFATDIPVVIIGSHGDQIFPAAAQDVTAAAYGVPVHWLDALCHNVPLDPAYREAAALIASLLTPAAN